MFSALLDTCVLVPSRARDVLLEVASIGVYRPLWSSEILAELDRTLRLLLGKRGATQEEIDAYLARLFRQMETAFPDALVTDWESLAGTVQLPDPGDHHVVAAARAGRADVIVTDNLAHFPPEALPAPLAMADARDATAWLSLPVSSLPARRAVATRLSPTRWHRARPQRTGTTCAGSGGMGGGCVPAPRAAAANPGASRTGHHGGLELG